MPKIGTLLNNLAKKAGYDTSLPAFTEVLSANLEIPDDLAATLESKLFNEDAAKNNPALKSYFFKQALDGVDKGTVRLMDEFQFDEEIRKEISGITNTYERIPALVKKIQELESKKIDASKGDKALLQDQINKLNQEKAGLIAEKEREIAKIKSDSQNEVVNFMKQIGIQSANLVTDQYDKEVMVAMANQFIDKELTTQGAKVVNKDGALKLVQASDEALDFYLDNKAVTWEEFRDSVLSKYKLIAVNKPPATPPGPNTPPPPAQPGQRPANSSFLSKIEQAKADLATQV
jgi:hypothetical protein